MILFSNTFKKWGTLIEGAVKSVKNTYMLMEIMGEGVKKCAEYFFMCSYETYFTRQDVKILY